MPSEFDIIIVGAGPAGMAAAIEAAKHGASVCILDEQYQAGGQIYRNVESVTPEQADILGKDYLAGRSLVDGLKRSNVDHRTNVVVWSITKDGLITYSKDNLAQQVQGKHVVVATGAIERPVPIPGWTLPGVITAGAAQIMMKSDGLVAQDAVLVGSGPLLYLVATQLLAAGSPPKALVETQTSKNYVAALPYMFNALRDWKQLLKGVGFLMTLKRAKVPRYTNVTNIAIEGDDYAVAVSFDTGKKSHRIETSTVLLHQGVVPNTQISRSLELDHRYDDIQRCFHPVTDEFGRTSNPNFSIAGDGAGIGGAKVASLSGKIAALNALRQVKIIDSETCSAAAQSLIKRRFSERAIRPFLDTLYAPPNSLFTPEDNTIICRCEEIRAGDIRQFAALGCATPNQAKIHSRCGMGPCQSRNCGLTVSELLAAENKKTQEETGAFRIRAPLKPIALPEMAALTDTIQKELKP
ncbi:MAG: NAD(P)/FAD-dependent oxidoreductase [Pseudomonadota bacterium]